MMNTLERNREAVLACLGLGALLLAACGVPADGEVEKGSITGEPPGRSSYQENLADETEEEEFELKGC